MFDDLHDPNPPAPDMATLAVVSGRARSIRRRRLAVVSSLSTVAMVAVAVAAVTRDDDPGRVSITGDGGSATSPVDCPAVGLTYVGAGISVALIQDPVLHGVTFTTDDPGPLHAERGVTVEEGDLEILIGRVLTNSVGELEDDAKAATVTLPNGRELGVVIGVSLLSGDDRAGRVECILESAVYDPERDSDEATVVTSDSSPQTDPAVVPSSGPGETDTSTSAPVDCPAVGLRYVGVGVSAALINDFTVGVTETTDDPGPLHAERGVEVGEGDVVLGIGRGLSESGELNAGAKDAGTVTLPNGRELHVVIGVNVRDGDGAQRVPCLLDSAIYDPELDMLESQDERMIVAIDGDGDAVVRQFNRSVAVLHDGTDPDDALPEEGEVTYVDGVAVPLSYDEAWVGICCEPVAGSLLRSPIDETATYDNAAAGFGHFPVLSPDDRYLAAIDYLGVQIRDLDSDEQIVIDLQSDEYQQATSIVWTGTERLAVQIATDTTSRIVEYIIVDGRAVESSSVVVASGTSGFEPMVQLVGAGALRGAPVEAARVVWLWNREQASLDAISLDAPGTTPETTLQAPSDAMVVKVLGNEVRWVDESRRLWTAPLDESGDPEQIPGEYVWVG